jgi:hypothetical protein
MLTIKCRTSIAFIDRFTARRIDSFTPSEVVILHIFPKRQALLCLLTSTAKQVVINALVSSFIVIPTLKKCHTLSIDAAKLQ